MAQFSSQPTPARPRRSQHRGVWAVIAVLLLAVLVGTLWVPLYNKTTPAWGGWPFFYWYQLLWVPVVALVSWCAYLLSKLAQGEKGAPAAGPDGGQAGPGDAPPLPRRTPPTAGGD
jgi:hypothetical protein